MYLAMSIHLGVRELDELGHTELSSLGGDLDREVEHLLLVDLLGLAVLGLGRQVDDPVPGSLLESVGLGDTG